MIQDGPDSVDTVLSGSEGRSPGSASLTDDRLFHTAAVADSETLDHQNIRDLELDRARHALAYLKRKLGNEEMRRLLSDDSQTMMAKVRGWVDMSAGAWQSGTVTLIVPGPSANVFQNWYVANVADRREAELRAGHPEHFISHPLSDTVEVVENIGETELPWHVFYRMLPEDFCFPTPWDPTYSGHYGMELLDSNGLRVGFSMRQARDEVGGLRLSFTTHLPKAAPPSLVRRHLNHFAIEFRNWARAAWLASSSSNAVN